MSPQETGKNKLLHVLFRLRVLTIVKEELYGSNFILVTPSGECITVLLPEVFPSHHVHIPYLVKTPKRLMNKEEYESSFFLQHSFCDEIARQHLSDEASIDMEVVKVEEELLVNHHVYLKGILKKENGMYTLSYGKGSKLIISSKEITSLNVSALFFEFIIETKPYKWNYVYSCRNWSFSWWMVSINILCCLNKHTRKNYCVDLIDGT